MKIDRARTRFSWRSFGRTINRLIEQKAMSYQEAVEERGSISRAQKAKPCWAMAYWWRNDPSKIDLRRF